ALIIIMALTIASIGLISAASDEEIMQFARGVLANEYYERTASINGENLSIEGNLSEFSDGSVNTIGYELQNMAASAKKIVDEYPDRFHQLDFKLFDFSGNKIVGIMRIFA
ncbi:MAG: hypothetical protein PHY05_09305, partial [Methanothrix sp.]|nr:hypothetical protein [Methanothrix sp.]